MTPDLPFSFDHEARHVAYAERVSDRPRLYSVTLAGSLILQTDRPLLGLACWMLSMGACPKGVLTVRYRGEHRREISLLENFAPFLPSAVFCEATSPPHSKPH